MWLHCVLQLQKQTPPPYYTILRIIDILSQIFLERPCNNLRLSYHNKMFCRPVWESQISTLNYGLEWENCYFLHQLIILSFKSVYLLFFLNHPGFDRCVNGYCILLVWMICKMLAWGLKLYCVHSWYHNALSLDISRVGLLQDQYRTNLCECYLFIYNPSHT